MKGVGMRKGNMIIAAAMLIFASIVFCACGPDYLEKDNQELLSPEIDFIQFWHCKDWTAKKWDEHIARLQEEGYLGIILQTVAEAENGAITSVAYDSSSERLKEDCQKSETAANLLTAAKGRGFHVYLGLADDKSWWGSSFFDEEINEWVALNTEIISELYGKFYAEYPATFKGFYFSQEIYTQDKGYEGKWARLVNEAVSAIDRVAPAMPLIISPFKSGEYKLSKNKIYKMWSKFFEEADLREVDIFAPQDGFGRSQAEFVEKDAKEVEDFLQAAYSACLKKSECKFYVNIEFFSKEKSEYATKNRLKKQIGIASKYADGILTFSFSHYYI